jgi:formylglycine-generating enzyme required for sulfatase activity
LLGQFGWFQENSGKHVHPPRELRPSLRGVFDQHGNVFEWTHDWFADYELGEAVDPQGAFSGSYRVIRGGCWGYDAAYGRLAFRYAVAPSFRSSGYGFRVALSPSGASSPEAGPVQRAEPLGGGTEGTPAEQRPELP